MIYVLDASAMIAYLRDEPGGDVIERALLDTSSQCLAHAINLCEVFYDFHRAGGESAATSAISDLVAVSKKWGQVLHYQSSRGVGWAERAKPNWGEGVGTAALVPTLLLMPASPCSMRCAHESHDTREGSGLYFGIPDQAGRLG